MLPKKIEKAYTEFYNSVSNNDILDPKTTFLIRLSASMAIGCYP